MGLNLLRTDCRFSAFPHDLENAALSSSLGSYCIQQRPNKNRLKYLKLLQRSLLNLPH